MQWVNGRAVRLPGLLILAFLVIAAMLSGVAGARAQTNAAQGTAGLISLDVVDADLSQVVRILMSESKQSIVIGDTDVKQKKVTAMLNNVPLETALRYVVESVGASWRREPDGVYIIGPKSLTPASAPAATPMEADSTMASRATGTNVVRRDTRVETIKLYNTSPSDMMWVLGIYKLQDAPRLNPQPAQAPTTVVFQKPDGGKESVFIPEQTPPLTESLKGNPSVAERAPQVGSEAMQMPPAPPSYGGNRQGSYPYRPGQGQTGQPGANGQQTSGLLPSGIDYVLTYDLDNSLIVRGDDEGIEELKTIISKLDVAPKQIMIEARFVSIATSEMESLGINWSLEQMNTTFSTQFATKGNILLGFANGNLMANLKTQMSKSHGKLINAPIVTTMNNVPASIGFQTQVPYLSSTTVFNQNGGASSASATYFLPVTSQLYVLPRINNADNSITVNIMPQISDIEKYVDTGENGSVPIVNTQFVQTQRRVSNGETIVLGGLIRKDDNTSVDKIPLIGDLPIIGPLFRNTNKSVDDKELLIFLTPTIIPEKPIAGTGVGVTP
jgi:type II secretory pathway component GspD/PulD (secretin)